MDLTKSTWATRYVPDGLLSSWAPVGEPVVGDVLACEVLTPSMHGRIETRDGTRAKLFGGDRIACVVGNRYATSLLEGEATISSEIIHLLSASGLCGRVVERCAKASKPTTLRVLAQAMHDGRPLNVRDFASTPAEHGGREPLWIVVVGSAMDAGKTTACASIIHGLRQVEHRVGAAKLTGTTSARDISAFRDAGAVAAFDFSHAGWASTAGCSRAELREIVTCLADHVRAADVDVAVLEVADGLLQAETNVLIDALGTWIGPVQFVLAARESLAAVAGARLLSSRGHTAIAVTGVVTSSPLFCREVEQAGAGPCIATADLGTALAPQIGDLVAAVRTAHPVDGRSCVA